MHSISAVYLSTTMFGEGQPMILGTVVGAFIIAMLSNGLTMLGMTYYFQDITTGVVVILAVVYTMWLVYAAGLEYLLANCMFYALGLPVYIKGKMEKGEKPFKGAYDYGILGIVVACGILCLILLLNGTLVLF